MEQRQRCNGAGNGVTSTLETLTNPLVTVTLTPMAENARPVGGTLRNGPRRRRNNSECRTGTRGTWHGTAKERAPIGAERGIFAAVRHPSMGGLVWARGQRGPPWRLDMVGGTGAPVSDPGIWVLAVFPKDVCCAVRRRRVRLRAGRSTRSCRGSPARTGARRTR